MPQERRGVYHLKKGEKRTTATLPATLAELLALRLGHQPDDDEAHQAIRDWLQARLDEVGDPLQVNVSQWLQAKALLAVADDKLSGQHDAWSVGEA